MEILIIGVLFVALMVYVSTRIKRSAAEAYEREEIETENFSIIKPDNLMHPFRDKSEYAFEAYSKDFGDGDARSIWRAHALLRVLTDTDFRTARANIKKNSDKVLSDKVVENSPPGQKVRVLETLVTEDEQLRHNFWKIVEDTNSKKVYELKVSLLEKHLDDYREKAREMIESFRIK